MVKTHVGVAAAAVKRLIEKIETNGLDVSGDVGLADLNLGQTVQGLKFPTNLRIEFNLKIKVPSCQFPCGDTVDDG